MYIRTLIWAFEGLKGTALDKLSVLHICSESTHPPLSYLWMCLYLCTTFVEKMYLQTVKKVHSWKYMHVCNNLVLDIGTSSPTTSITSLMHISSTAFHILNSRKVGIFRLYEWVIESQYPTDHLTTLIHTGHWNTTTVWLRLFIRARSHENTYYIMPKKTRKFVVLIRKNGLGIYMLRAFLACI